VKKSGVFKAVFNSISLLYRRMMQDSLLKEASALTYQSFLAFVPLLAVMFGIAKGFGIEQLLDRWLHKEFADHQEVLSYLLQFSQTTLKEAQGGVIAGIGVFFLLFTAIRLISSIEAALNAMWGVHHGRSSLRKVSDYLALLLTCPILLAISSSVTIFITTQLTSLTEAIPIPASAHSLFLKGLALVPFAISALLFSVILYSIPCTPVSKLSACLTGCITAVAFQFIQSWYILFQLRLTKVSAVYGSFVALPLFLVWLWISWLLILIAGELLVFFQEKGWRSYVFRYSDSPFERLDTDVMVIACAKKYFDQGTPLTLPDLFTSLPRPIRALTASVQRLEDRGFILKGWSEGYSTTIIPSKETFSLSLSDIILPASPSPSHEVSPIVAAALEAWKTDLKKSPFNLSIDQLPIETHCLS
jgi:membrane protein